MKTGTPLSLSTVVYINGFDAFTFLRPPGERVRCKGPSQIKTDFFLSGFTFLITLLYHEITCLTNDASPTAI